MDAEKLELIKQIRRIGAIFAPDDGDEGPPGIAFAITEGQAVALLTRAIEEETQALRAQVAELREAAINAEMDLHGTPDGEALAFALARVEAGTGKADGWISIKDRPPKQEECVDIWSKSCGRLANYKYVINYAGKVGNNFFDPVRSGIVCIRDATHWMPIPDPPATDTP